ncbi:TrbC/VirB2 family protein [Xylella fastidiosa]|uniref:TrbC/VirB2 family protein n=1 Tax=Xylella fastidiosa TaxID=2371 RepID=UPI0012B21E58|nr:TrbC/VirB2 family protein [Xylella fastidiosa]MSS68113.1 conjugal transfer protein [Xylella fastidiosa subsp. multiplex]
MKIVCLYQKVKSAITANHAAKTQQNKTFLKVLTLLCLTAVFLTPEIAMAAIWDEVAQKVLAILTGGLTRTIAIISVIACGIAAIAGKLSWDWAIKIVIGIVLIFGAASIVDYIVSAVA